MSRSITVSEDEVTIPVGAVGLAGRYAVPAEPRGLVIVPLRSSEGRDSDHAATLTDALHRQGLATLLLDLLTDEEQWIDDLHPRRRLGDEMLADRLSLATDQVLADLPTQHLPVAVLAAGPATAIVRLANLPIPTIVSMVGAGRAVQGSTLTDEDSILRDGAGVGVAA